MAIAEATTRSWRDRLLTVSSGVPAVAVALWAAVRVLGVNPGFPGIQLLALTPYLIVAGIAVVAYAAVTRRIWPAFVAAAGVLVLGICVVPRVVADARPVPDAGGPQLRVMSANLRIGAADPAALVARVRSGKVDLLALHEPAATVDGPVRVLLGDFNATLDHAPLRKLIATGYRDAADVTGTGITHTWSHDGAWYLPGFTLDHILADRRVGVKDVSVQAVPGSDHRCIAATLVLPRTG